MPRWARPSASSRATMRESALWLRCTAAAELLHARPVAAVAGEALEHLELADPEVVLA